MNTSQQLIDQWIRNLGKKLGIELSLDADGSTCIECEGDVQVFVEMADDSPLVCLYAPIVRLPDDLQLQNLLLTDALKFNNFSLQTGASCLGFDTRTQHITLTFAAPWQVLDEETFAQTLGDFIELSVEVSSRFLREAHADHAPSRLVVPAASLA